jgi:hypothetical protein
MSYVARHSAFQKPIALSPASVAAPARRSLWRWLYDAIALANQRQAERDIARFVSTRGKFTDSVERDISERALRSDWNIRD